MEFLRFGSSIPGAYWGCCACCIIQNFKMDPDEKSSIQLVDGDGGIPITGSDGGSLFAGPTWKDIFLQRLRVGTFSTFDMPNHAFFAILTESQISGGYGKKWLAILKEQGFEFLRAVDNSVYSGDDVIEEPGVGNTSSHPNYIFALFRNVGDGAMADPFTPPKAWTDLPTVVYETWEDTAKMGDTLDLTKRIQAEQLPLYNALPWNAWMTEEQLKAAGVPVIYAGMRSAYPQQPKEMRDQALKSNSKQGNAPVTDPFAHLAMG